jgi:hypothetical protein
MNPSFIAHHNVPKSDSLLRLQSLEKDSQSLDLFLMKLLSQHVLGLLERPAFSS